MTKNKKNEGNVFKCRICGHTEYEEHKTWNGIDGPGCKLWTIFYCCKKCSVIFENPQKFSVI